MKTESTALNSSGQHQTEITLSIHPGSIFGGKELSLNLNTENIQHICYRDIASAAETYRSQVGCTHIQLINFYMF